MFRSVFGRRGKDAEDAPRTSLADRIGRAVGVGATLSPPHPRLTRDAGEGGGDRNRFLGQ